MADHTSTNGTGNPTDINNAKLAAMLRECAAYVERNEFHPDLYQALGQLHAYAGQHSNAPPGAAAEAAMITPKTTSSTTFDHSAQHLMSSLGKKFQKGLGLHPPTTTVHPEAARATSQKNAERVKADFADRVKSDLGAHKKAERGHRSTENDWCDEHFCLGCACKEHTKQPPAVSTTSSSERSHSPTPQVTISSTTTSRPAKPAFQRPVNPNSILIANGWIEQQRRSKMRVVWKDVLASLVEGRKPNEETTLWIQRETLNPLTGKQELEALHQIPIKWIMGVEYLDYSTDNRFALKVYNVSEEFLFRCANEESAQNWVLTLRSVREVAMKNNDSSHNKISVGSDEKEWDTTTTHEETTAKPPAPEPTSHRMTISELRAIAHGAGINTAGMERQELEAAVAKVAGGAQSDTQKQEAELRRQKEADLKRRAAAAAQEERRKREAEAEEQRRRAEKQVQERMRDEAERRRREEARRVAEERRQQAAEEEERRRRVEEEQRRREEEIRRREDEKRRQEEIRRRKQAEEEQRRQEELRRRQQAEEARRQAEEARRRQQAEEELRRRQQAQEGIRRAAEQQAAEQRRRQEEAQRQQWQQQQQRAQQQQWQQYQQQPGWQQRQQAPPPQQQQWQQQQHPNQQQQQFYGGGARAASPPGRPHGGVPSPPQSGGATSSPINMKYAKMAAQDVDDGQATITAIKHNILIHWALQPPTLQMLRPIDALVTSIHTVFPPVFGVPAHDYFGKWKAIKREDVVGPGNRPEEEKLKKSVRKLRFFLHPDKLPRDLNDEQQFMCKMLWDITSDAWEEFEKHKEELDWIRN